jgi:hypothetical protein
VLTASLERVGGESSSIKDPDDNVVMTLTLGLNLYQRKQNGGVTVRIINPRVLMHRVLVGYQILDMAMHEGPHQPRTRKTPLLQHLD